MSTLWLIQALRFKMCKSNSEIKISSAIIDKQVQTGPSNVFVRHKIVRRRIMHKPRIKPGRQACWDKSYITEYLTFLAWQILVYWNCSICGYTINKASVCVFMYRSVKTTLPGLLSKLEKWNLAQLEAFAYTCLQLAARLSGHDRTPLEICP